MLNYSYKQAEKAVQVAIGRLREMNVKIFRPADYYAEMVKSDEHMQKVRQRMADIEEGKQKQEAIRRLREEKKFAAKVQKEVSSCLFCSLPWQGWSNSKSATGVRDV
ncbi:unnamed protein product [Gongylonema pulchrum]|uniref:PHB domain-containing protein n=1 Tax=Gongylonema pulchrum TaxID=637853 RepID=A0A183F1M4_9BILA|nr:unnamed protein product [Gongylonema pulchrum]